MLHRADESQPARNSCPRLPHSVDSRLGLLVNANEVFPVQDYVDTVILHLLTLHNQNRKRETGLYVHGHYVIVTQFPVRRQVA